MGDAGGTGGNTGGGGTYVFGQNPGPPSSSGGPQGEVFNNSANPPPPLAYQGRWVWLRGYGTSQYHEVIAMSGDDGPKITGGYAKWNNVDRPLRRGITVFQGYDPATMDVNLRLGVWGRSDGVDPFGTPSYGTGWDRSWNAGVYVEQEQVHNLEWMAGAHFTAGQSPFVYVNSYGFSGGASNWLVPYDYQTTVGVDAAYNDPYSFPWIMGSGIEWGACWRNEHGQRIWQECKITLTNFMGFEGQGTSAAGGFYFTTIPGRQTINEIAAAPSTKALYPNQLAYLIQADPKNNPIAGTRINLSTMSLGSPIALHKAVWVPAHVI